MAVGSKSVNKEVLNGALEAHKAMGDKAVTRAALTDSGSNSPQAFEPRVTQLRALVVVAKEGSYTRAARQLAYTESAVFLQVKALERLVGMPVVERRESRIVLTPAGEVIHKYALRILGDVELMAREIAGLHGNKPIAVGGGRSTSVYYLTPLIAEFTRLHPEYQVDLNIMPAEDLVAATEEGLLDLAATGGLRDLLGDENRPKSPLRFTPWIRGTWSLVLPASEEAALSVERVYVPDFAWHLHSSIKRALLNMGLGHATLVPMTSGEAVKSAALHGLGAAVLPAAAVRVEAEAGIVSAMTIQLERDAVMLVHRRPRLLTAGAQELLRFLISSRRDLSKTIRSIQAPRL